MLKCINVYDRDGKLLNEFKIDFLQRETSGLQLDQKSFYLAFGKVIPDENVEMMIHESATLTVLDLLVADTHIHKGNDGNMYICYPKQITSMEEAIELAKNWCLLTTFHLTQKADVSWFESFGKWMVELTVTAVKEEKSSPKPFEQFPLWIQNGWLGWKVEVN